MTPASSTPAAVEPVDVTQWSMRSANIAWVLELIREGDPEQAYYALVDSVCAQLRLERLPDHHLVNIALRQAARS